MTLENGSEIEIMFVAAGVIILLLLGMIAYLIMRQNTPKDSDAMRLMQEHLFNLSNTFDRKLSETNKFLDSKLSESNKLLTDNMAQTFATTSKIGQDANKNIENLTKKLTQLEETNHQIKDIWGQLRGLEDILKNPKKRWNLWEYFLKELLENVFSQDQYKLQYTIDDVGIVDAALFIWGTTIPIDSKFPQENYDKLIKAESDHDINTYSKLLKKDIKNRVDEASKYIIPEKWTSDFSFMLIPAEGLYYDIFISKVWDIKPRELIEYAFSKKVIISSPSSFYAYLQTVLQGMKALQIEWHAKEIQKYVIKLQKDLKEYESHFNSLGKSLSATVNHYNKAGKRLEIVDKDIIKITQWEAWWEVDVLQLEKPEVT